MHPPHLPVTINLSNEYPLSQSTPLGQYPAGKYHVCYDSYMHLLIFHFLHSDPSHQIHHVDPETNLEGAVSPRFRLAEVFVSMEIH